MFTDKVELECKYWGDHQGVVVVLFMSPDATVRDIMDELSRRNPIPVTSLVESGTLCRCFPWETIKLKGWKKGTSLIVNHGEPRKSRRTGFTEAVIDERVNKLTELGFREQDARLALVYSAYNLETAVNNLLIGKIPSS